MFEPEFLGHQHFFQKNYRLKLIIVFKIISTVKFF